MSETSDNREAIWHYVLDGQQQGPVTESELSELLKSGQLSPDSLVWRQGMVEWQAMNVLAELKEMTKPATPSKLQLRPTPPPLARDDESPSSNTEGDAAPERNIEQLLQHASRNDPHMEPPKAGIWRGRSLEYKLTFLIVLLTVIGAAVCQFMGSSKLSELTALPVYFPFVLVWCLLALAAGSLFANILYYVRLFQIGILWGLMSLFIPIVGLIATLLNWAFIWRCFMLNVLFVALIMATGHQLIEYSKEQPEFQQWIEESVKRLEREAQAYQESTRSSQQNTVLVYSTSWCGPCKQAKALLRKHGIPFKDYDIESNAPARREFEKLGGRGVPLLVINGTVLEGYDERRILKLCGK
ncbi:GYF domain-containing protein [Coraliomargarita akajimensis]|uniref:Glutaredoxin n=1 Tax=Coraliomargarita akajimensis (strain DSM 45221 / IAM 15411 / JCM 23193 / KCTC 12865 / 04OKA010-24) TaxID=583355 RepID=D5EPF4_CORAD|nr:GYF domain-containing protein [Coraliomargarita akajimensis]ADE53691.1 glutaredoxin [Coraliomargarita akajimensis DSM 45221]